MYGDLAYRTKRGYPHRSVGLRHLSPYSGHYISNRYVVLEEKVEIIIVTAGNGMNIDLKDIRKEM